MVSTLTRIFLLLRSLLRFTSQTLQLLLAEFNFETNGVWTQMPSILQWSVEEVSSCVSWRRTLGLGSEGGKSSVCFIDVCQVLTSNQWHTLGISGLRSRISDLLILLFV